MHVRFSFWREITVEVPDSLDPGFHELDSDFRIYGEEDESTYDPEPAWAAEARRLALAQLRSEEPMLLRHARIMRRPAKEPT
jgi:hypothetical protein